MFWVVLLAAQIFGTATAVLFTTGFLARRSKVPHRGRVTLMWVEDGATRHRTIVFEYDSFWSTRDAMEEYISEIPDRIVIEYSLHPA